MSDDQESVRNTLLDLHRGLLSQHEKLQQINCTDESFRELILAIQLLLDKSAELVAETATAYLPCLAIKAIATRLSLASSQDDSASGALARGEGLSQLKIVNRSAARPFPNARHSSQAPGMA